METINAKLDRAREIAIDNLRQCYSENGIIAGKQHFTDIWARDSCQAGLGAARADEQDKAQVKKNLKTLIRYQREDGLIPLRVGAGTLLFKLISKKLGNFMANVTNRKPAAIYTTAKDKPFTNSEVIDSGTWLVIAVNDYAVQTNDWDFAKANFIALEKAIRWTEAQDKDDDGLIEEGPYANWADSIAKKGKVLYSNILYAKALKSISNISEMIGKKTGDFSKKAERTKEAINKVFWNGRYYIDWIDDKVHDDMPTYGNALAIVFGIADSSKGNKIADEINKVFGGNMHFNPHSEKMGKNAYPLMKVCGMADYSSLSWLLIGCMDSVAKLKLGRKREARKVLAAVADRIIAHNCVYEIYDKKGRPVKRLMYKSEGPFAWSAGLYLFAYDALKNPSKN